MQREALEIFERILAAPAPDATRLLDELCPPGDPRRQEVLRLLSFDAPTEPVDLDAGQRSVPPAAEAAIAGFRIEGVLGTGATSVVYCAHQEVPPRRVALKVLLGARLSAGARRRFQVEVASLARLNHPGIAQVFTAGVVDQGVASGMYLAMELVEGRTLVEHCRAAAAGLTTRVRMLAEIAEAVAYAHARGVLHRDLKPSNILVDETGEAPRPKVLDFGIARILDADRPAGTQTDAGFVGTIAYAAPERLESQAGGFAATDLRTDVYSLGVLAFELLSGRLPIDVRSMPLGAALDRIRRHEAPRLGRIDRALRGDLECIVARALAKDPTRRYRSAEALAEDLRRYLTHRPVDARSAGAVYRLRRWTRRHRAWASLVVLVGLGGILTAATWVRDWQRTRGRLIALAAALRPALAQLDGVSASHAARAAAVDGLLAAFDEEAARLPEDPELLTLVVQLLHCRGDLDRELGAWRRALATRQRAMGLAERLVALRGTPEDRRTLATAMVLVGDCRLALGHREAAAEDWQRAHVLFVREAAGDSPTRAALDDLGCSHDRLARLAHESGDDTAAMALLAERAVVNQRLVALAPDDRHTLLGLCDFHSMRAAVFESVQDLVAALAEREAAFTAAERVLAQDREHRWNRRRWLEALGGLAGIQNTLSRFADCARRLDAAAQSWQGRAADDDLERQAMARLHLERCRAALGLRSRTEACGQLSAAVALLDACSTADRLQWAGHAWGCALGLVRIWSMDADARLAASKAMTILLESWLARPLVCEAMRATLLDAEAAGLVQDLPTAVKTSADPETLRVECERQLARVQRR